MYPVIQQDKKSNANEIHILSVNTLDSLISINIKRKDIASKWIILKDKFDNTANYYATADDLVFLSRLANNLTGAVNPVHINYYSGQAYFVFTGTPALKIKLKLRVLGSRAPTPIIANFAVGSKQAIQSIKSGTIITVVLVSSFRALEHFFSENNKTTLLSLFGTITSDIIKLGISSAIAAIAVKEISGATTIFALTSGPLFLAIGVSLVVGNILNHIDNKYEITQKFKLALEKTLNESLKKEEMRINDVIGRSYIKNGVFL
ncbi:hypothetical protein [Vibrio parahaemolyticus]|nr:hypothetical protein [Vibrio parahaemolyticus]